MLKKQTKTAKHKVWKLWRVAVGRGTDPLKPEALGEVDSEGAVRVWLGERMAEFLAAGFPMAALKCTDVSLSARTTSGTLVFTATTETEKGKLLN
jgi:hypothetical protein